MGIFTERRLTIVFKIRSKLTAFFFTMLEDSDIPPTIDKEILLESFKDFNLIQEKAVYICHNSQNCKPKVRRKRFDNLVFCKVNKWKWKLEKIAHKNGSFIKLCLRPPRNGFEVSLRTIKKGLYTPQRHYSHRCHSLQQHSAGANSQRHRPRHRIYSDEGPILRFYIRYNRHRHRPTDGIQQLFYTLGSGTMWQWIWTTHKLHSQVQVSN